MNTKRLLAAAMGVSMLPAWAFALPSTIESIDKIGGFETGTEAAAEIVAYDPGTKRAFVVNGALGSVDVLDISDPTTPVKINTIDVSAIGASANSVAVKNGLVAVAVQANVKTDNGSVAFFDTDGNLLKTVGVGALPDMLTFTPDGTKVLVANEGEPNHYGLGPGEVLPPGESIDASVDPEGSVSIIDLSGGVNNATAQTAGFGAFIGQEDSLRSQGIRIYGPNANAAQDFEPEFVAVTPDGTKALVGLQENNAVAVVDLATATVTNVIPLGFKNHGLSGNGLDASDRDDDINIDTYDNLFGMYQPDGLATFEHAGKTYLITANEGDARDYFFEFDDPSDPGETIEVISFREESRMRALGLDALDPAAFPDGENLRDNAVLGRLTITTTLGDTDGDTDFDELYVLGGRSFSIFEFTGAGLELKYDSGEEFERTIEKLLPDFFNATNDENEFDNRSDNKGPEPEDVELASIGGRLYALIGLERIGGFMVYDITDPLAPFFFSYVTSRDFSNGVDGDPAGDLGPEGLLFIPAADSPNGLPLFLVGNEISGSTAIFQINPTPEPVTASLALLGAGATLLAATRRRR